MEFFAMILLLWIFYFIILLSQDICWNERKFHFINLISAEEKCYIKIRKYKSCNCLPELLSLANIFPIKVGWTVENWCEKQYLLISFFLPMLKGLEGIIIFKCGGKEISGASSFLGEIFYHSFYLRDKLHIFWFSIKSAFLSLLPLFKLGIS